MKKVKLMLLSLSILAVVAGALAFRVKTGDQICTAAYDTTNHRCPGACPSVRLTSAIPTTDFICTAATVQGGTDVCHNSLGVAPACGSTSVQQSLE